MVQDIRTIGLPALLSFHMVARFGGISAAAVQLGQAKSGVSRHVAQLEAHFGVRLLERGARSVSLTPIGARLDARIASILAEVDLLGDLAREESVGVSGQVTVAATPEFGGLVATMLFPEVRARHPDLTLVMRPAYEFEDMQDASTDVAFRLGRTIDERLVVRELGTFQRVLVARSDVLAQYTVKVPGDLSNVPCLTFRGDTPGGVWRFFKDGTETEAPVAGPIAVRSFAILRELACQGEGFAFLPDFMVKDALSDRRLVRVLPDYEARSLPVYLSFRPGAKKVARVAALIAVAEEVVPTLLNGAGFALQSD